MGNMYGPQFVVWVIYIIYTPLNLHALDPVIYIIYILLSGLSQLVHNDILYWVQ